MTVGLDLLLPTLVLLALAGVSLGVRKERLGTLGFRRVPRALHMAAVVLGLTLAWTVLQTGLIMPVLNRVTGQRQDLTEFKVS